MLSARRRMTTLLRQKWKVQSEIMLKVNKYQNVLEMFKNSGIMLLNYNVSPYTAARTLLPHFNWELFDHPPQSSDLASAEYQLLTFLKNWFNGNYKLM
jgi:hypothetical protein